MYPSRNDPKICRVDDLAFRLLCLSFEFANDSPWKLGRQGWLYHNVSFPVTELDFQRCVPHHTIEEVKTALDTLCAIGGAKHSLLLWDGKRHAWRVRNWRKWQDGFARDFTKKPPEIHRDSSAIHPHKTIDVRRETVDKTSCRSRAKPRKYTDEQYALGMEAAEYAMEAAKDHTGFEEPSGYRFPQFLSFFCQRAKLADSLQDCKDCVDEYFRRLKEKNAEAAERGLKRHHMGGFAGFKGTRDSLAGAVLEKREGNRANTPT